MLKHGCSDAELKPLQATTGSRPEMKFNSRGFVRSSLRLYPALTDSTQPSFQTTIKNRTWITAVLQKSAFSGTRDGVFGLFGGFRADRWCGVMPSSQTWSSPEHKNTQDKSERNVGRWWSSIWWHEAGETLLNVSILVSVHHINYADYGLNW